MNPGITSSKNNPTMAQSILENVIYPSIDQSQDALSELKKSLKATTKRGVEIDNAFSKVITSWKQVQATYILGDLDSDMIDTPRLIDTFHQGNENLTEQIKRALSSGDNPKIALFKNTFKSVNALEILLYKDDKISNTEKQYADYVLLSISQHLSAIKTAYQQQVTLLNKGQDKSMSYLLNALIDSSFKLKEWRIGEASGLAKKYKKKPKSSRQEYFLSSNSLAAAAAIIKSHDEVMGNKKYLNLGDIAIKQGAVKQVKAIRDLISKAKKQLKILNTKKVSDFKNPLIKPLYITLKQLNDAYYQSLVKALPVQAKILDADGD